VDKSMDKIFEIASELPVEQVAIEVNGQQEGFIGFFKKEMVRRNVYFKIIEMRKDADKFRMLNNVLPMIKDGQVWVNENIIDEKKSEDEKQFLEEMEDEFDSTTKKGIKAKHDDVIDMISAIQFLKPSLPDPHAAMMAKRQQEYETEYISKLNTYVV
jgi:hypothetical protein